MFRYGSAGGFWLGVVFLAVGLLITIGSYMVASGGGTYVVSYGLIIIGIIRIVTGIPGLIKRNKQTIGAQPPIYTGMPGQPQQPIPAGQAHYCWNCKRPTGGQPICPACGAPQNVGPQQPPMSTPMPGVNPWGQQQPPMQPQPGWGQPPQAPYPPAAQPQPGWGQPPQQPYPPQSRPR